MKNGRRRTGDEEQEKENRRRRTGEGEQEKEDGRMRTGEWRERTAAGHWGQIRAAACPLVPDPGESIISDGA